MKRHPVPTLLPPIGLNSGPVAVEVVARIFRLNTTVQTLGYPVQRRPETHITDATGPKRLGDASIIMETVSSEPGRKESQQFQKVVPDILWFGRFRVGKPRSQALSR